MGSAIREVATSIGPFRPRNIVFATGRPPSIDGLALEVPSDEVKGHMAVSQPTDLPAGTSVAELARVIEDGRLLVGGTLDIGDHERVVRAEIADALWRDLVAVWPPAKEMHVDYRWACFRPVHPDRVPVIDRVPGVSNAWFTSGHYKTGILLAPATGRALAQWIATADRPPEIEAFSVSRFMPKS
jgi:glycine/D-amino acid oxidase-like deaminating enzyme